MPRFISDDGSVTFGPEKKEASGLEKRLEQLQLPTAQEFWARTVEQDLEGFRDGRVPFSVLILTKHMVGYVLAGRHTDPEVDLFVDNIFPEELANAGKGMPKAGLKYAIARAILDERNREEFLASISPEEKKLTLLELVETYPITEQ